MEISLEAMIIKVGLKISEKILAFFRMWYENYEMRRLKKKLKQRILDRRKS